MNQQQVGASQKKRKGAARYVWLSRSTYKQPYVRTPTQYNLINHIAPVAIGGTHDYSYNYTNYNYIYIHRQVDSVYHTLTISLWWADELLTLRARIP